ncbi:hypothetical protein CEUSTIGMA_g11313.t1 [Chlamydomonas eustigma]|uniref:Protein kinase domain-containing protein n=1 Tax=Chlamydomonas eustigma TaxID=1157962 RepID=A0A250XLD6_9CHLO|nr:hypothetical protein CEUSTIGMA_g11313.t1 [Chlamydomonas eustigma]|eukprot:GAX83888.1 hypothetical protein CEUSTIGMA_g11313.t1 [Chlamydomonas eustigma]
MADLRNQAILSAVKTIPNGTEEKPSAEVQKQDEIWIINEADVHIESPSAKSKWQKATRKITLGIAATQGFSTLRDQHGLNEIDISELNTLKKLGEGAFAVVEQCLYTPKSGAKPYQVAVKKLKPSIVSHEEDLQSFLAEIALMRKLNHNYIVDYIGIGYTDNSSQTSQRSSMFLVSELLEGGTLKRMVMNQMKEPHRDIYRHVDALRWCINIADALAYLHEVKPVVIHRDLKLENILLKGKDTATQEAKISDFGLVAFTKKKNGLKRVISSALNSSAVSNGALENEWKSKSQAYVSASITDASTRSGKLMRKMSFKMDMSTRNKSEAKMLYEPVDLPQNHDMPYDWRTSAYMAKGLLSGRTGTYMYMAPEMFLNNEYNEKVDVFSFGICMYELLHKYMMIFAVSVGGTAVEIERYAERVAEGYRPTLNNNFPAEVLSIITDAWAQDPNQRPSMRVILERLRKVESSGVLEGLNVQGNGSGGCGCIVA